MILKIIPMAKCSFVQMTHYQSGTAGEKQLNAQDNIIIQSYNPAWPKLAEAEIKAIKTIANRAPFVSIEHIGSTAIPELSSKPIIDIFISVKTMEDAAHWIVPLQSLGYLYWKKIQTKHIYDFLKECLHLVKEELIMYILSNPAIIHLSIACCSGISFVVIKMHDWIMSLLN